MYAKSRNLSWLILSLTVFIIDQATKYLATQYISYGQPIAVLPFLNLTLAHNPGAAFSIFSSAGGWQRWFFIFFSSAVSLGILVWLYRLPAGESRTACALSLILGGALGNLCDRIVHGFVIDFIQVYYQQWAWPDFNIADSAITLGAILFLLGLLKKS